MLSNFPRLVLLCTSLIVGQSLFTAPTTQAKSSGGRSSGGSFSRPSTSRPSTSRPSSNPPSSSQPRSSSPATNYPQRSQPSSRPYPDRQRSNDWNQPDWNQPSWDRGGPVMIPVPSYPRYPSSGYPSSSYPSYPGDYGPNSSNPSDFDRQPNLPDVRPNSGSPTLATPQPNVTDPSAINPNASIENPTAPTLPSATVAPPAAGPNPAWILLPGGAIVIGGGLLLYKVNQKTVGPAAAGSAEERNNDIVTVSELQLALLANSPIQQQLSAIVEGMDITTPEQLKEQLQAVVLDLLRLTEYWSHAQGSSQTFTDRQQAESHFTQGSMEDRAQLNAETLTRDSLGLRQQPIALEENADPAAYVVVTLRLGSTDDRPLFTQIRTAAEVEAALNQFARLTTAELLTFELIWSPQAATDSLSRDELMTEYTNLVVI
jgi:uncharacterized membrane protein